MKMEVNEIWQSPDGRLFRVTMTCDQPTCRIEEIEGDETLGGAQGCLLFQGFQKVDLPYE
jgi:hypothetical protein